MPCGGVGHRGTSRRLGPSGSAPSGGPKGRAALSASALVVIVVTVAVAASCLAGWLVPAAPSHSVTTGSSDRAITPPRVVLPLLPLVLTPAQGAVGSSVAASGETFPSNTSILFTFNGTALNSTCTTDASGYFPGMTSSTCTFTVPKDPLGGYRVFASAAPNSVSEVGPTVGTGPDSIAYDPQLGELFVTNFGSNNVSVLNDSTGNALASITVGTNPSGIAFDVATDQVFVANYDGGSDSTVSVISTTNNTVAATVPVGPGPSGVAYDPRLHEVLVADSGGGVGDTVSVISDTSDSVVATVMVGVGPNGLTYDPATGETFVANGAPSSDTVSVIDDATNQVTGLLRVGQAPSSVVYDTADREVFVANALSNSVSVLSTATSSVVATVPVGGAPAGLAYDPAKAEVFVTNPGVSSSGNVSVISTAKDSVVQWITAGLNPSGAAYDAGMNDVFVANSGSDNLTEIFTGTQASATYTVTPPVYRLAFIETGLPANQTWSVTLSSSSVGPITGISISSTVSFGVENGSYTYAVGSVAGYAPHQLGGTLTIDGGPVTVPVSFVTGYPVTFSETGSAVPWTLTINGLMTNVTGGSTTVQLPNGSFPFTIGAPVDYDPISDTGVVNVDGGSLSVLVPFAQSADAYPVAFNEVGLPSGSLWSVTIGGFTVTGTGSTIVLELGDGTFAYTVGAPGGYSVSGTNGTFTVAGQGTAESIDFAASNSGPTLLWLVVTVVAVAVAAVAAGTLVVRRRRRRPPARSDPQGSSPTSAVPSDSGPPASENPPG